ncbi:sulfate/molybdate ABC transporter ATP-binding protein [Microbacterium hominis]|nr:MULTISPECIES: ABC transporter ATP-binding protein [Microbacterium]
MTVAALDAYVVVRRDAFVLDAEISAAAGEIVAVMGPSGAGKSTLLDVVSGLMRASAGEVRVGGEVVSSPAVQVAPQRRGVVLLGQDPRLFPHLSARDNVAFGLRVSDDAGRAAARVARRAQAQRWLENVGLPGVGHRRPAELSGGQQQRVALARALATAPRLLLLDEPFTALDPVTVADIRRVLAAHLRASGTTTLFVTHDVVDAVTLADRLVVIEDGRVSQQGPAREVLTTPATDFVAALGGVNRVPGRVQAGVWTAGAVHLPAPGLSNGDAVALIPTGAVRVRSARAAGERDSAEVAAVGASAPGIRWSARVVRIEATAAGVRLHTREPAVVCELAIAEFAAADVAEGDEVRLSIGATDVRVAAR